MTECLESVLIDAKARDLHPQGAAVLEGRTDFTAAQRPTQHGQRAAVAGRQLSLSLLLEVVHTYPLPGSTGPIHACGFLDLSDPIDSIDKRHGFDDTAVFWNGVLRSWSGGVGRCACVWRRTHKGAGYSMHGPCWPWVVGGCG